VPPRIHVFLWLLAKNKLLTRDNIDKRRSLEDLSCLFYSEPESAHHLFFECCVASSIWNTMSEVLGVSVGRNFESIAKLWLRDKHLKYINLCNAAVLWCLWKTRNDICFQDPYWRGTRKVLGRCARTIKNWSMLLPGAGELDKVVGELEKLSASPLQIAWRCARQEESVASSLVDVITSSPDEGSNSNVVLNCIDPGEVAQLRGGLLTPEERSCELVL
jgi:hypothetical protein